MLGRRRWVDHGIICSSIGDGARYGKLQKYHNFQQYFTSIFKNTTRAQWPQAQLILPHHHRHVHLPRVLLASPGVGAGSGVYLL